MSILNHLIRAWGAKPENEGLKEHVCGKRIVRIETRRHGQNARVYCIEVDDGTNIMLMADGIEIRGPGSSPTVWQQSFGDDERTG